VTNKKKVYIETTIVSYLTARPSRDLLAAAWQKVTVDWWDTQRHRLSLFASDIVIEEAGRGGTDAAERRVEALSGIPLLAITEEVVLLAEKLVQKGAVPRKAIGDSLHIPVAAVHGVDYLLTRNYRRIGNAETKPIIRRICLENNHIYPEICTPQELMGEYGNA